MKREAKEYTVCQLARLAGVSVRTLHHYDQIGLLQPGRRNQSGYRLYQPADLLRLQQILFFRELDLPLQQIKALLDDPDFDPLQALREHQKQLEKRAAQIAILLNTVEKTINQLMENTMELTDAELYEGFSKEQAERYDREARQIYGDERIEASLKRVRKLSKAEWEAVKQEGDEITRQMASLMEKPADDPLVQQAIARQWTWLEHFYPVTPEIFRGLGSLYTDNPEFTATYDRYQPGLATFMKAAMEVYADRRLK
jgi:DNA-binding transcriptional MerR regulator